MEPFREALTDLRKKCAWFIALKDQKIPFYDKLPKSNMFCTHYFHSVRHSQVTKAAAHKAEEERMRFVDASEHIDIERE